MRKSIWLVLGMSLGTVVSSHAFAADPGKAIYEAHCSTCHGENGKGLLPGIPDLTQKGGSLSQPDTVLLKHITDGYQAPGAPMAMPPKGGDPSLTDEQIKEVLAYLEHAFRA